MERERGNVQCSSKQFGFFSNSCVCPRGFCAIPAQDPHITGGKCIPYSAALYSEAATDIPGSLAGGYDQSTSVSFLPFSSMVLVALVLSLFVVAAFSIFRRRVAVQGGNDPLLPEEACYHE